MAGDKARDRVESGDSGRGRNAVIRAQEQTAARMAFFNGPLGLSGIQSAKITAWPVSSLCHLDQQEEKRFRADGFAQPGPANAETT